MFSRVSETERKNNEGITFSIQHEDNIYFQYLENFSEQKEFYSVTSGDLENLCSAINCIQVSKNVIDDFHIKVSEGVSLSENDFIHNNIGITNGLKIHYANKTSGIIEVPENKKEIFYSTIKPLLENAGVGTYTWSIRPMEYAFEEKFGTDLETFLKIVWGMSF